MQNLFDKASLVMVPSGYDNGKLYNIKPEDKGSAFEFERSSMGTRVNSSGLIEYVGKGEELVTNGTFDADSDWLKTGDWSISGGVAIGVSSGNLSQNFSYKANEYYLLEFEIKNYVSGSFGVRNGNITVQTVTPSGNGIYSVTQQASGSYNTVLFFNSGSFNGQIDNVSVKQISNDKPRIDYTSGEGVLLLEPQRTNLVTYSEDFTQWSKNNVTLVGGYSAPDGTNTAYKVSGDSTSSLTFSLGLSGTETRTIWAKTVSGTGQLNLTSHNANTNNLFTITENWQRFEVNGTTSTSGRAFFYAVDFRGSSTLTEVIIWGAQAEVGSYATSYIPTNEQQQTRAADLCINAGSADTFNDTEGVLYAEVKFDNEDNYEQISVGSGTNNMFVSLGKSNNQGDNAFYIRAYDGTNIQGPNQFLSGYSSLENNKIAFQYGASISDFKIYINGNQVGYNFSGTVPTLSGIDKLSFRRGSGSPTYGTSKMIAYFPETLTDEELQRLTSPSADATTFTELANNNGYTIL